MSNEKREKFLESIKQNNKSETQDANNFFNAKLTPIKEDKKQPIFIEVPKDVEDVDYANVFFNSKVQTEVYNRKQEEQEK